MHPNDKLKSHQLPMTVDEQIENLCENGLIINNKEYARLILNDISYFRLIKAYSLGLKVRNGNYYKGIRFEDIVQLYLFDSNFRQVLYPQIEKIEINFRCRLSNYFSSKYGVLGYEEANNFAAQKDVLNNLYSDITKEISRKTRSPFIMNFQKNYMNGKIPLYALVEVMSFGTLSRLFKNMKNEDKKAIASYYGIGYTYLESWLENLSYVRNICAHYGRLYNAKLTKTPRLYKHYTNDGIKNTHIFATLLTLKHLLPNNKQWHDFIQAIKILINKYPSVKLHRLGFPQNWVMILICTNSKEKPKK